jgi:hypothetical protein
MNSPVERIEDKVTTVEVESTPATDDLSDAGVNFVEPLVQKDEKVRVEEFKISGDALVAKVKQLIHQGNIRRIIIKNEDGRTLIEVPLTVGVVGGVIGAALFPVIAALGVIGALVTHLTIVVERKE